MGADIWSDTRSHSPIRVEDLSKTLNKEIEKNKNKNQINSKKKNAEENISDLEDRMM